MYLPIYQDGGAEVEYFTETQGVLDAMTAASTARRFGFQIIQLSILLVMLTFKRETSMQRLQRICEELIQGF